jgi:hypothetical protein
MYNTTSATPNTNTQICRLPVTGTITATQNSTTITGAGTNFLNQLNIGDVITIASVDYIVRSIESATSLTLTAPYVATTGAGLTVTRVESIAIGTGSRRYIQILSRETNTGTLFVGESRKANKDGADVTSTARSHAVGVGQTLTMLADDLREVYIQSPVAGQGYSINIF